MSDFGNLPSFTLDIPAMSAAPRVVRFEGDEGISSLYEFRVEIAAHEIDLDALVGTGATLTIDGLDEHRHLHGEIADIEYIGETRRYSLYALTIVPALARLRYRYGCRIFQGLSTPEIVREVLKLAALPSDSYRFNLAGDYAARDYCVQYRESELAFLSRLLEEDGIYYFFEHTRSEATLVFADDPGAHPPIPGSSTLLFNPGGEVEDQEHIRSLRSRRSMQPGKVALRDLNLHAPHQAVSAEASGKRDLDLEVYDYPGEFQESTGSSPHQGATMAKIRLEALQVPRQQFSGTSDSARLTPGHVFSLNGHRRSELNADQLITHVHHKGNQPQSLEGDGEGTYHYSSDFASIPRETPFRPPRTTPRPFVRGVQTATVVGAGSEEVHTDEQGRILVLFHWDREGKADESASCWVRVSQPWAGKGWGAMFIPRVGHEVIVDFIHGDPDRPVITGALYTGDNAPPYPLPEEKTKTTIKSDSSPGGGGFNELRFEDRAGEEEIFIHAQKDLNEIVLHDRTLSVGHDQRDSIDNDLSTSIGANKATWVGVDHSETIGANMELRVGASCSESIAADHTITIGSCKSETVLIASTETVGAAKTVSVGLAYSLSVGASCSESVVGLRSISVGTSNRVRVGGGSSLVAGKDISQAAGTNLSLSAVKDISESAGKDLRLSAKDNYNASAGKSMALIATKDITIKCGSALVTIKKNGSVSIKAKKLSVKVSGKIKIKGSKIALN